MSCHVCFGSSGGLGVLMPAVPMPAVPMPGSADESQELFPGAASLASHGVEFVERNDFVNTKPPHPCGVCVF